MLRKSLIFLALLCSMPCISRASNIAIFPTGPNYQLNNIVWGSSGANGFNNNFFFTPFYANESVCINVYNNNPTGGSLHSFQWSIVTNNQSSNVTPNDSTWIAVSNGTSNAQISGLGGVVTFSAFIGGVPLVSLNFSASSSQPGNPDTATISISQTQGQCSSSIPVANPTLLSASDQLSQGYSASGSVVNPVSGSAGMAVTVGGGTVGALNNRRIYYDKAIVDCSAACTIIISVANSTGNSCTLATNVPLQLLNGITLASATAVVLPCATPPALNGTIFTGPILASTPTVIDLTGFIDPVGQASAVTITSTGFTGTLFGTIIWHERQ